MIRSLSLIPFLALGACAQPFEGQIATRLSDAGLPPAMAQCMAGRWVDRLSLAQLQRISTVAEDLQRERGLTVSRFLTRVRAIDDPEIFGVVTSSAAVCALTG
jgi:hypothetical protein